MSQVAEPVIIGRYAIFDAIGGGGMAQVYLGRLLSEEGFSRVVAVKRVHPAAANDVQIVTMLLDEARLVARVRHPNVVPTIDVAKVGRELILVMEYIRGASLSHLIRTEGQRKSRVPLPIAIRASIETLVGLHAAHEAKSERGRPLEMVHRDVSPHNILVGVDGVTRIADFGIAKAEGKLSVTREGEVKGKLAYMAPEQLRAQAVDRRTDVFAMGIVLWELCAGLRLFEVKTDSVVEAIRRILQAKIQPPSTFAPDVPPAIEAIIMRALSPEREQRFDTAEQMANALEDAIVPARTKDVAAWVAETARPLLESHADLIARIEERSMIHRVEEARTIRPTGGQMAPIAPLTEPMPPPADRTSTSAGAMDAPVSNTVSSTIAVGAPPAQTLPLGQVSPPVMDRSSTLASGVEGPGTRSRGTEPRASRSPVPLIVLAALLFVSVVGVVYGARTLRHPVPASSQPPPSVEPPLPMVEPPTPPPSEVVSVVASASASPPAAYSAPRIPTPVRAPPIKPRPAAPDCNPPYSIDANGLRVPRPECAK